MDVTPGSIHPKLVITTGDVRGIGPEVVAKALSHPEIRNWADYLVVGPEEFVSNGWMGSRLGDGSLIPFENGSDSTGGNPDIRVSKLTAGGGPQIPVAIDTETIPEEIAGRWAGESVEVAVRLIDEGAADALVTAPIDKKALIAGGYPHSGHTDLLKTITGSPRVTMMLVSGELRVSLVTTHVSYTDVRDRLVDADIRGAIRQTVDALRGDFNISAPRVAVCGLNPHGGEKGALGLEEDEIIEPIISAFSRAEADISGPYPSDTVFSRALAGEFDAVVAMYHDQGLGPFKVHSFGRGVNMTLGLPFVRTSPDHGTARDIAGRGVASERSMIHAIRKAREVYSMRRATGRNSFDNE
jgi:4-hydroxythreonine-4-phosphate dehydrogenase